MNNVIPISYEEYKKLILSYPNFLGNYGDYYVVVDGILCQVVSNQVQYDEQKK
jgi:hypothetical protein